MAGPGLYRVRVCAGCAAVEAVWRLCFRPVAGVERFGDGTGLCHR
ncbi:hypothetical protein [Saccharothrix syringae]|nr:hypothetical protein [Saccharothrix syringae]